MLDGAGQIKAELLTVPLVRTDSRDAQANKLLEIEERRSSLTVYTLYNLVLLTTRSVGLMHLLKI